MKFQNEKYLKNLGKLMDFGVGDNFDPTKQLCQGRGLRNDKEKKLFQVFCQIMKAATVEELEGISIEQILECWERRKDFENIFERKTYPNWLKPFGEKIEEVRSVRPRRVL